MDVAASNAEVLALHARELLIGLGEDPDREGLRETPGRVARALMDLTDGYGMSVEDIVGDALFHEDYDQLVVVRDIPFFSLCEHHLLPFFGVVHVGYVPGGRIIGLSKIPRIVDMFARRLQVQERLTREIAEGLSEIVNPHGVGVVLKADHMCMAMRGVEKIGTTTTTSVWLGSLRDDPGLRADFMRSGG